MPSFLRFNTVSLCYETFQNFKFQSIEEKCQSFVNYLLPFKNKALYDTNLISFFGRIHKNDPNAFSCHTQLLDHVRDELLPVCNSSRGYKFEILFYSDINAATHVITSIIKMSLAFDRCTGLEIILRAPLISNYEWNLSGSVPIEAISNWLNQKCDGTNEKLKERILRISSGNSQKFQELIDHFKKTFKKANFPVLPYIFKLEFGIDTIGADEDEILINKVTGENLTIHVHRERWNCFIEIKRCVGKKNAKTSS